MEARFRIPRQQSRLSLARFFVSTGNTLYEYSNPRYGIGAPVFVRRGGSELVLSGCRCFEHGPDARVIQIAGRNSLEKRADAGQFGSHEAVHQMQTPIEPSKHWGLDLVVNCH